VDVDVDAKNNDGFTALMLVSFSGHDDIVKTLLDAGADKDAKCGKYITALTIASARGKVAIVQMLKAFDVGSAAPAYPYYDDDLLSGPRHDDE